jgi:aconitate hydratase
VTDEFKTLKKFDAGNDREGFLHSLPALEEHGIGKISRLPVSIRIVLESVLRNCDGKKVRRKDVETLANWNAKSPVNEEIPFVVARIVLQDFTGVPLVVDLAAMRSAVKKAIQKSSSRSYLLILWSITRCKWISLDQQKRCN